MSHEPAIVNPVSQKKRFFSSDVPPEGGSCGSCSDLVGNGLFSQPRRIILSSDSREFNIEKRRSAVREGTMSKLRSVRFDRVKLCDPVFAPRIRECLDGTIPASIAKTRETGRIDAFRLDWKEGMPNKPHIFWDSDVAKLLEGIACSLALRPDPELEKLYDDWVDLVVSAQQPDGYLNVYFTVIEPDQRWQRLGHCHELYCAGHMIEAAVAGFEALGKRKLLDCVCRYADYIDSVFGLEPGKRRGWPGHEEIELALVKLYRVTGNERYLRLAEYFINDRGTEPNIFVAEESCDVDMLKYRQADKPVREQRDAAGHAVRAVYLYSGMADVGVECGDESLLAACRRLFESIRRRRMYVTGGIGSSFKGEAFAEDYDLSNGSMMYAESCAAIGLAMFAGRMFNATRDPGYLDVAEQAIYNGILSGVSVKGDTFFYDNYLEVDDNLTLYNHGAKTRQPWFLCSCCPTNFARFVPQLGSYLYSVCDDGFTVNIPAANRAKLELRDQTVEVEVRGGYPYDGKIEIEIKSPGKFFVEVRIPGWCRSWSVSVNGEKTGRTVEREWKIGDTITLDLDMPVDVLRADPRVTTDAGRIALRRGPLVYALEEIDQEHPVRELLLLPEKGFELVPAPGNFEEGALAIRGQALAEKLPAGELYTTAAPKYVGTHFLAIPYALWQNRGATNMAVWMRWR